MNTAPLLFPSTRNIRISSVPKMTPAQARILALFRPFYKIAERMAELGLKQLFDVSSGSNASVRAPSNYFRFSPNIRHIAASH